MGDDSMIVGPVVATAVAIGVGAVGALVGWWLHRRRRCGDDDDDDDVVRSFLHSGWVASVESASPDPPEEIARALHVHAKSLGKAVRLERALLAASSLGVDLAYSCPSTDLFEMFIDSETARDPHAACNLTDLKVALSKFADERGVHLGRRALTRARLRARLTALGLGVDENDCVRGLACTLWA